MSMICPYCQAEMPGEQPFVLRRRWKLIYDAVAGSGPDGITMAGIRKYMPGSKSNISIRVAIHYTNKAILPLGQKIKRSRDMERYILTRIKGEK